MKKVLCGAVNGVAPRRPVAVHQTATSTVQPSSWMMWVIVACGVGMVLIPAVVLVTIMMIMQNAQASSTPSPSNSAQPQQKALNQGNASLIPLAIVTQNQDVKKLPDTKVKQFSFDAKDYKKTCQFVEALVAQLATICQQGDEQKYAEARKTVDLALQKFQGQKVQWSGFRPNFNDGTDRVDFSEVVRGKAGGEIIRFKNIKPHEHASTSFYVRGSAIPKGRVMQYVKECSESSHANTTPFTLEGTIVEIKTELWGQTYNVHELRATRILIVWAEDISAK